MEFIIWDIKRLELTSVTLSRVAPPSLPCLFGRWISTIAGDAIYKLKGEKLHEQIDEAIRVHEKVLLILSESSMNSEWVKTEIAKARKREVREKRKADSSLRSE